MYVCTLRAADAEARSLACHAPIALTEPRTAGHALGRATDTMSHGT